jgi:hypothetical protein
MSERGRSEEGITPTTRPSLIMDSSGPFSLGVINISAGPIQWVITEKGFDEPVTWAWGGAVIYTSHYGVPDPKIQPSFPKVRLTSKRIKRFGLVGKVTGLRWRGEDFGLGLVDRLNGDPALAIAIITGRGGLDIRVHPKHGCWTLTTGRNGGPPIPSLELWDSYQTVARQLLATPMPPDS